jgi:hypothetical protein
MKCGPNDTVDVVNADDMFTRVTKDCEAGSRPNGLDQANRAVEDCERPLLCNVRVSEGQTTAKRPLGGEA